MPLAPGATADIVARIFAEELGKSLGQTVVVDNKTGAGGTIATAEAARAPRRRLHAGAGERRARMVFNIGLYKAPGYDPLKDLAPVAVSGGVSNVLIVHPDNPAKTVADVLAQARAKPGELTYSSGGVGTSHHMSGVLLELRTGVKLQHVPYRATPAGIMAVANGEVAMGLFNTPTVIGLIKAGKLKAIAVTSEQALGPAARGADHDRGRASRTTSSNTWMGFAVPGRRARTGGRQAQCRAQPHRPVAAGAREDAGPGHRNAAAGVAGGGAEAGARRSRAVAAHHQGVGRVRRVDAAPSLQNSSSARIPCSPSE